MTVHTYRLSRETELAHSVNTHIGMQIDHTRMHARTSKHTHARTGTPNHTQQERLPARQPHAPPQPYKDPTLLVWNSIRTECPSAAENG